MITFSARLQGYRARWMGSQREFNELLVRPALLDGVKWWLDNELPKRFLPGAVERYQLPQRTLRYEKKKRYARTVTAYPVHPLAGIPMPNPNYGRMPPAPFVFTGYMRDYVETLRTNGALLRTTKTVANSSRQEARVRIPYGHPINTKHAKTLGKRTQTEMKRFHQVCHASLLRRMRDPSMKIKFSEKIA